MNYNIEKIRKDFPSLHQKINGKLLKYLDNAATTLKPQKVIDTISHHYSNDASTVHRGLHTLSNRATEQFENARSKIQNFIKAKSTNEIVFTHGTTEGINIIARGIDLKNRKKILLTELEHHSNIVPWQLVAHEKGARVEFVSLNENGTLNREDFQSKIDKDTAIFSLTLMSNALGTITEAQEFMEYAKQYDVLTLVDAAQAVAHKEINVQKLNCDFLVFSGHKIYGPTGIGILYGREKLLNTLPPLFGGGAMIKEVTQKGSSFLESPYRFEAGTPHIAGAIGLSAAIDYINSIGIQKIENYENELLNYALSKLQNIKGSKIINPDVQRGPIISFILDGIHSSDIGTLLNEDGIAVRTGHHCAMPLFNRINMEGSVRISFSLYNTKSEIDALIKAIKKTRDILT